MPHSLSHNAPVVVWFRDDLRLTDNPALRHAVESGRPLVCAFVHDEESAGLRRMGGAAGFWLSRSLKDLSADIAGRGGALVIRRGAAEAEIARLVDETAAALVVWNRRYGAAERAIDARIREALTARGLEARSFSGNLAHEPWTVKNGTGDPYRVFTPFWRAARASGDPAPPVRAPARLTRPASLPESLSIDDLALEPQTPDWAAGIAAAWQPGEEGARARLDAFLDGGLKGYAEDRNRPDLPSTSRLSPHLRFGEISVGAIWHATLAAFEAGRTGASENDLRVFFSELGWREFSYHLLFHNADLGTRNFQPKFDAFAWQIDGSALRAWQRGRTGYPIVDAGMRELWTTGWMHNRVRMIVASFLCKHLLIDWREGERWFWDTLVDADPASNTASWQWVAGSGADAAPYFRIFNPIMQGEKFDPDGSYVRRFVPELARLDGRFLHKPWQAPREVLARAGVRLGETYPKPIVDHDLARNRALAAYEAIRSAA
jgi:deoxyribodipyrimidine photo-lyase